MKMKLTKSLLVVFAIAHISLAVPYREDLSLNEEEQSMQANPYNSLEEAPEYEDVNPANNGKEWTEQSLIAALKRLGTLDTPGLKLVKLPESMINLMKRMPNQTVVRPNRYVLPEGKAQEDAPTECIGVLQDMYTLLHADSRLAYQAHNVNCTGSCTNAKSCVLEEKPVIVYLMSPNNVLVPKKVNVGCTCSCM